VRPVSACALVAACFLLAFPNVDTASAAPHGSGRGFAARASGFAAGRPLRPGAGHGGLHRHRHSHRFAADGWGGYVDGFGAPIEPAFLGPQLAALSPPFGVPVVMGIREARPSEPAIIVIGHHGKRVRRISGRHRPALAEYRAAGPLIIDVGSRR
jgi:hypothetical protein